ncbi:unnamed protein product [Angiostrongylus costaricensis]|uniref:Threonylcarbamoyladenosine tRNA methylthiotransferase n=1 Tax=Angiostrongylus costaricensis TaxID=334426 RepID=A0A158PFR3_ANGCS|nr:unnamed protein product [Angiostrongylus costaricensis]
MADIEDDFDICTESDSRKIDEVQIKIRSKRDPVELGQMDSFVPGVAPVWIKTWGCSHNSSDSEYMAGVLAKAGYPIVRRSCDAKIWVLNTCTVKTPSETVANNLLQEGRKQGKFIVMAGCVSQASPDEQWLKNVSIVGVKQIDRIVEVVEETLKGNTVRLLSRRRPDAQLSLPKMRKNELIEACTAFERDGVKELWLTSEDLGAWGRDINMVLPDLLNALVKVIPDGCMMRLGMTNPPYILDYLEDIAAVLNHPRVYSFLHIPVQSGSDAVLRDMKREYTCDHFRMIVDFMLKEVPNIYIATDMICAFPTETDEDFEESMELIREYQFPSLFINQFYPRSGTPAAAMKKIDTIEARRRTAAMSALFRSYSRYTPGRIGEEHEVLVCEMASDGVNAVGHNKCYEHFLLPYREGVMGNWIRVRITEVSKFYMRSVLCGSIDDRNKLTLTDWTAKQLDSCQPMGVFRPSDTIKVFTTSTEKSPMGVIVLSIPLVIGMIFWYIYGI